MKTPPLPVHLIAILALAASASPASADWKINDKGGRYEVRVWATPNEAGLDFYWSGKTNARHEAEGNGTLQWSKPAKGPPVVTLVYTGELKAGRRHGTGVSLQRSGSKYSGEWSEGLKEGKGEYWFSNGDYYAGLFHNDLMHGAGRYVSADGTVFEGTFASDERDGPGTLILPDGRRYSSTWKAGKDTDPAGAPAPQKPYLMVNIDVRPYALDGKLLSENQGSGSEFFLTYRGRSQDGVFTIDPDWPYWVAWSQGGPVVVGDEASGDFDVGVLPAFLDLRLVNPGRDKLEIRKAEIVVEESHPDLEPILRLSDASDGGGVTCQIVNFTANPVTDCEVAFNILPWNATPTFDKYEFTEKVDNFTTNTKFSLERAMAKLGIAVDAIAGIEKAERDGAMSNAVRARARRELGKFPKFVQPSESTSFLAYAVIAGEVRIGWTDHAGAKQTNNVKFQFRKCFARFGAELGAFGASSGKYDVALKTTGKGYLVPFAYKRSVAPGANDRFTLQVAADASSYHSFRIRLNTTDGHEILSPPCRLHFLVPRDFSWKDGAVIKAP